MSKIPFLTQQMLKAILAYDPLTGLFVWKERADVRPQWNGRYAGKIAGYARVATGGGIYWSIRIFDWPFHSNRLAWLYMTGEWPEELVDHADRNGLNDRWENLRAADKSQNAANAKRPVTNTTGFKGVSIHKKSGRFRATIRVAGRQVFLGHFDHPEDAHAAYVKAAIARSGEFARAA
jgi:hypothetical protein